MVIIFLCLCAAAVYALQDYLYGRFWDSELEPEVNFQKEPVYEGEDAFLTETVTNRKWLPLTALHVKFQTDRRLVYKSAENASVSDKCYKHDIFSLMPFQKITRTMPIHCAGRGYFEIKGVDLTATNIFMSNHFVAQRSIFTSLYVFPRQLRTDETEIPFRSLMGNIITKRMINEDPFEFRGIRDYQPYDPIKHINWKASAKAGNLLVNVFDYTAGQEVRIIVNLEDETYWKEYTLLEASLRLASSLAARLLMNSVPVSLMTTGCDVISGENRTLPAGSGPAHLRSINELLARIDLERPMHPLLRLLEEEEKSAAARQKQLTYLLISYTQRDDLYEAYERLTKRHSGSLWLLPLKSGGTVRYAAAPSFDIMKWEVRPDDKK